VIGDSPALSQVKKKLAALTPNLRSESWRRSFQIQDPEALSGVVLVGPVGRSGTAAVRALVGQLEPAEVPLFVVIPDGADDRTVRALYRAGATAVMLWPAEARQLGSLLAESLGASLARGLPDSGDEALVRSVRAHLRDELSLPPAMRIEARTGVVDLSGQVDSLPEKQRIAHTVSRVRGVRGVVTDGLFVAPSGRSDRAVSRDVNAVMKAVSQVAEETLSVTVENGYLSIAGSTSDHREMNRLLDVLAHVRGVRGVRNYTTVSPEQKANDKLLSHRLGRMLEDRFPRERLEVSAFGHVAVVSGTVRRLAVKRDIAAAVRDYPAIGRVVNKLAVE